MTEPEFSTYVIPTIGQKLVYSKLFNGKEVRFFDDPTDRGETRCLRAECRLRSEIFYHPRYYPHVEELKGRLVSGIQDVVTGGLVDKLSQLRREVQDLMFLAAASPVPVDKETTERLFFELMQFARWLEG